MIMNEEIGSFTAKATILVPPFHMYHFNMNIDGWIVIPNSGGTIYIKNFDTNSSRDEWHSSVINLQYILLSCFLEDFAPRVIERFDIENIVVQENIIPLLMVFGQKRELLTLEERSMKASYLSGELFNGLYNMDPHYMPDTQLIKDWYTLLKKYNYLALNLHYIQQSFICFNRYFSSISHFDPTELFNGILFLVSGLEGIFLKNQNDYSDLSFKFRIIGSVYYDRYCDINMLRRFKLPDNEKFSIQEIREILKELYDLRSKVAHGSYQDLYTPTTWKKIIVKLHSDFNKNMDIITVLRQVSLALGLFQKHVLSLIIGAKENLLKGANIIDDLTYNYSDQK